MLESMLNMRSHGNVTPCDTPTPGLEELVAVVDGLLGPVGLVTAVSKDDDVCGTVSSKVDCTTAADH